MIKLLSLFSGIGAFESALKNLGIEFELVNYCEIDKYASKSYSMIHGVSEDKNLVDVTKITEWDILDRVDLLTYGFPCQDISLSGKQKGLFHEDGSLTRSGLFFSALDVIKMFKPKVAIAENVKNLTSKKFSKQFKIVLDSLDEAGYNCYWQVLNSKNYGIPQNRDRVFIVSIRKDVDNGEFTFPKPIPLTLVLKDMLDDEVDEKYYIKKALNIVPKENYIQWDNSGKGYNSQQERAYYQDQLCPTLSYCNGGGDKSQVILVDKKDIVGHDNIPKILVREATKKGYAEAVEGDSINLEQPNSKTRRGRVGKQIAQTLTTSTQLAVVVNQLEIRKLTPIECFRVMGFKDEEFNKITGISNTQLYKQAGNSIVVPVLEAIFTNLYKVVET